jgi:DNA-binding winged helix-turn-helix (wHTH) protein
MSLAIGHCYQFGEFTVDCDQKVLLRNGSPLPLAPKVFDTLFILISNNGRLVEKDELIKQLWPNTFVEESNLTFNIQQVRKILGDNAREPRFIETVARRGYRFIAHVQEGTAPSVSTDEVRDANREVSLPRPGRSYLFFAVISLLLIGVVVIAWFARGRLNASADSAAILSAPFKSPIWDLWFHTTAIRSILCGRP